MRRSTTCRLSAQYVSDRPQRLMAALQRVSSEDRELLERLSR